MKITKNQFKKIIQEELSGVLGEADETQHWEVDASPIGGGKITVPTRDQKDADSQDDARIAYYDYEAYEATNPEQAVELMLIHYLQSKELTDEQKAKIVGTDDSILDKRFSVKDATGKTFNTSANENPIKNSMEDLNQKNILWNTLEGIQRRARFAAAKRKKDASQYPAMGYPTAEGMKITKSQLKQIIQEELSAVLGEGTMGFADALNKPAEGSTNWCKQQVDHYQHLLNQEKDLQKKNRFFPGDEHTEALGRAVARQLKKLESASCGAELQAVQEGTKQMKITKTKLKQIIQEELSAVLGEEELNELGAFKIDPGSPKHITNLMKRYGGARATQEEACEKLRAELEKLDDVNTSAAAMSATSLGFSDIKGQELKQQLLRDKRWLCPTKPASTTAKETDPLRSEAEEAAPTTDKKPGGHTFSSDPGSQQAALEDYWAQRAKSKKKN